MVHYVLQSLTILYHELYELKYIFTFTNMIQKLATSLLLVRLFVKLDTIYKHKSKVHALFCYFYFLHNKKIAFVQLFTIYIQHNIQLVYRRVIKQTCGNIIENICRKEDP